MAHDLVKHKSVLYSGGSAMIPAVEARPGYWAETWQTNEKLVYADNGQPVRIIIVEVKHVRRGFTWASKERTYEVKD